jgi:hypothetical protein
MMNENRRRGKGESLVRRPQGDPCKPSFGLCWTEPHLSVLTHNRERAPIPRPKAEDRKMFVQ